MHALLLRTTVLILTVAQLHAHDATQDFGHALRKFFFFPDGFTQMNHGAYGGTPRPVVAEQYKYVAQMEADIDPWMNAPQGYRACILAARNKLAAMINAPVNDTVLVDNASEGINDVLRNFEPPLGPDEYILDLSTAYAPFAAFYQWMGERHGVQTIQAPITWPVTSASSFVEPVRALLEANASTLNIRVAVISHVSAYPSVVLPVAQLIPLLHQYGIPVVVDGAHALGNIHVDVMAMGNPEYYFANTHKWYSSSKSGAILYVRKDRQRLHVPAPSVVDNIEIQAFIDRFIWTGTRDRTAFCAVQASTKFRESIGGEEAVQTYTQSLAKQAETYLLQLWNVSRMATSDAFLSSMVNVALPTNNATMCRVIVEELRSKYGFGMSGWAPVGPFLCYFRLSAQVYLELSDFQKMGQAVLDIIRTEENTQQQQQRRGD